MKTIQASAISMALIALTACTGSPQNPVAELNAFNDTFNARAAGRDEKKFLELYAEDTLWIASPKPPVQGRGEPQKAIQFLHSNNGTLTHDIDHLFVSEDGTLAVMIGTADFEVESQGVKGDGTYLFVMQRDGDSWSVAADMFHQHEN